jgi:hypothetical protein
MTKYWLAKYNSKLGLAVMRQRPGENSIMIAAIMLPQAEAESVGIALVRHIIACADEDCIFERG